MIIEKFGRQMLRNFNYQCMPRDWRSLAIDPNDHKQCLEIAKKNQWNITKIFNTHEHWDHIEGNDAVVSQTSAKIIAHRNAKDKIPNIDIGVDVEIL